MFEDDEDLEVVEPTLRGAARSSWDEVGPNMDSAVMDEFTEEMPAKGLWLPTQQGKGYKTADDIFRKLDPEEYEPTEPGIPPEELLPPPQQQAMEKVRGVRRTATPPPARQRVDLAAVQRQREKEEADRFLSRRATDRDIQMVEATPWLAAMGLSMGLFGVGVVLVLVLAVFVATRPWGGEAEELPEQPPLEAPEVVEEAPEPVPEEVPEEEVVDAPPEEARPVVPAPRPASAPEPPAPEPAPVAPAPAPAPAPIQVIEDEPQPKKKGLFRKKK